MVDDDGVVLLDSVSPGKDKENTPHASSSAAGPSSSAAGPSSSGAIAKPPVKEEGAPGKRKAVAQPVLEEDEDEVMEAAAPSNPLISGAQDDGDDELTFVGRTGANALEDFPHSRENCVVCRFMPGKEAESCPQCYCYVCDAPVAKCAEWQEHCKAVHTDAKWQAARQAHKASKRAPAPAAAPAAAAPAAAAAPSSSSLAVQRMRLIAAVARKRPWSFEKLLKEVEQIYPRHATQPAGLNHVTLKPYQLQSLAFMQDIEANGPVGNVHIPNCGGSSRFVMGERRDDHPNVRGGWLCDEMGMGKTMCLISLVMSNRPRDAKPGGTKLLNTVVIAPASLLGQWSDEIKKHAPSLKVINLHGSGGAGFKTKQTIEEADIILTTPMLNVTKLTQPLGVRHSTYGQTNLRIHRLIIDEVHLLPSATSSTFRDIMRAYAPSFVWCVTGTPVSKSMDDLKGAAVMLGHWSNGLRLVDHDPSPNRQTADLLKQLMIRHTMEQRLGSGDKALALPDATTETVWLDMSADERAMYQSACTYENNPHWRSLLRSGARTNVVELRMGQRRAACSNVYWKQCAEPKERGTAITGLYSRDQLLRMCWEDHKTAKVAEWQKQYGMTDKDVSVYSAKLGACTKLRALLRDLRDLRDQEPGMHAVVFTTSTGAHRSVVRMLKDHDFALCEFTGSTDAAKRHAAIRNFQDTAEAKGKDPVAKVFVVTVKTGSVGITLTAATRVYLLEPALDPSTEVQAAGRIRRLGQTRGVLIKRFAFKNSLDSHICKLHECVKDGRVKIRDGLIDIMGMKILNGEGAPTRHPPKAKKKAKA